MDSINTVNGIFRKYGDQYRAEHPFLSVHEKKVMRAIETCRTEDLGGRIEVCDKCGHISGQKLNMHPHLHCVVPGGGYSEEEGRWKSCRENYLLPVEVVKKRFRSLFLLELKAMYKKGELFLSGSEYLNADAFYRLIDELFSIDWVVYIKESFSNSDSVIEYLGRYTHRIAISNYRILKVDKDEVSFAYKDYKEINTKKTMTLSALDFIRRFMTHVLPSRYVRIRYYGIMSNRNKKSSLEECYEFFEIERKIAELSDDWDDIYLEVTGIDIHICPECGEGRMIVIGGIEKNQYRPPPPLI